MYRIALIASVLGACWTAPAATSPACPAAAATASSAASPAASPAADEDVPILILANERPGQTEVGDRVSELLAGANIEWSSTCLSSCNVHVAARDAARARALVLADPWLLQRVQLIDPREYTPVATMTGLPPTHETGRDPDLRPAAERTGELLANAHIPVRWAFDGTVFVPPPEADRARAILAADTWLVPRVHVIADAEVAAVRARLNRRHADK